MRSGTSKDESNQWNEGREMPKYGVHGIILDKAIEALGGPAGSPAATARAALEQNRGVAMLGSTGPDLFFWAPDYEVVAKLVKLYRNIGDIIEKIDSMADPVREVRDEAGEALEEVVGGLASYQIIKDAVEELQRTGEYLTVAFRRGLMAGVVGAANAPMDFANVFLSPGSQIPSASALFFNSFKPPVQKDLEAGRPANPDNWYWFDVLHYRRTGTSRAPWPRKRAPEAPQIAHMHTDIFRMSAAMS